MPLSLSGTPGRVKSCWSRNASSTIRGAYSVQVESIIRSSDQAVQALIEDIQLDTPALLSLKRFLTRGLRNRGFRNGRGCQGYLDRQILRQNHSAGVSRQPVSGSRLEP